MVNPLADRIRRRLRAERAASHAPSHLRAAAVLVPLLVPDESLLLTRRSEGLRRQPGDIAFPGGSVEPGDATPLDTALRESEEEVGLRTGDVTVLGQLDERGTVTGFRITPFVGVVDVPYPFETNHEVDALIEVPLEALRDPNALSVERRRLPDGRERDVYHYRFGPHDIWGITGRVIKEFLEILE